MKRLPNRLKDVVTRRRFLAASGAAAAAVAFEGVAWEPRRLAVTRHTLGVPRPDRPPARLAVLTDLHLDRVGRFHERVAHAVAEARPTAILVVGDAIDQADRLGALGDFLGLLPGDVPLFATLGNWEHWSGVDVAELGRTYERTGGRLLVDDSVPVPGAPEGVLVGTDDFLAGAPDPARAWRAVEPGQETLVMAHCPAHRDVIADAGPGRIAAVVSGHTHGGQIALGRLAPFRPPGSGRYVSGWYRGDGPDLFVSRGLGTSVVPVRLGAVPELAILEWHVGAG